MGEKIPTIGFVSVLMGMVSILFGIASMQISIASVQIVFVSLPTALPIFRLFCRQFVGNLSAIRV